MDSKLDDDALAERLFEAARSELPAPGVKHCALVDATRTESTPHKKVWWAFAAAIPVLAATALLGLRPQAEPARTTLQAEPIRALPAPTEADSRTAEAPPSPSPSPNRPLNERASAPPVRSVSATGAGGLLRTESAKAPPASLEEELSLLDQARRALLASDPNTALAHLAQYDKRATRRRLGAEATLLKIQVLAAQGRASEASALASQFVAAQPNSPLVDRARSFVERPTSGERTEGTRP